MSNITTEQKHDALLWLIIKLNAGETIKQSVIHDGEENIDVLFLAILREYPNYRFGSSGMSAILRDWKDELDGNQVKANRAQEEEERRKTQLMKVRDKLTLNEFNLLKKAILNSEL